MSPPRAVVSIEEFRLLAARDGWLVLSFHLEFEREAPAVVRLALPSWVEAEGANVTLAWNASQEAHVAWRVQPKTDGRWAAALVFEPAAVGSHRVLLRTSSMGTVRVGTPEHPDTPDPWAPTGLEARRNEYAYKLSADLPASIPPDVVLGASAPVAGCGGGGDALRFFPRDGRLEGSITEWPQPGPLDVTFHARHEYATEPMPVPGLASEGTCIHLEPVGDDQVSMRPCGPTPAAGPRAAAFGSAFLWGLLVFAAAGLRRRP